MTPHDYLRQHPFLGAMTDGEVRELLRGLRTRRVEAGGVVFRKDDPGDGLYCVMHGRILIVAESADGKELILNMHDPGEYFGEIALLDGAGRSATAIADEASELLYLGRDRFLAFIKARPETMIRIIALLCSRLRRATGLVEDAAFLDVSARLAKLVLGLMDDGGSHACNGRAATLQVTQRDLALMLGVSREFVNKLLTLWREAGIVEAGRRRLTVLDAGALQRVVAGNLAGRSRPQR
jgi:CRP-like cAMP-binding protein